MIPRKSPLTGGSSDKLSATLSQLVRALGRMLFIALLARLLGPEAYGAFVLLAAIEVIVISTLNAAFASPMMTLVPGSDRNRGAMIIGCAVWRQTAWGLLLSVGLGLGLPLAARGGFDPAAYLGFCVAVATGARLHIVRSVTMAQFRAHRALVAEVVAIGVPLAAVLLATALDDGSPAWCWWAIAIGNQLGTWACGATTRDRSARAVTTEIADNLRHLGRTMALGSIAYAIGSRLHPLIVGAGLGRADLAMFGAAMALSAPLRLLAGTIAVVCHPRLAARRNSLEAPAAARLAIVVILFTAAVGILATLLAAVLGPWMVITVFGRDFAPASSLIIWSVGYASLAALGSVMTVVLQTAEHARAATAGRSAASIVGLATAWPLVAVAGTAGAFASLLLSELVFVVISAVAMRGAVAPLWSSQELSRVDGVGLAYSLIRDEPFKGSVRRRAAPE